jgi:hypothetical protein
LQLLAELFRVGEDFHADAAGPQRGRNREVVVQAGRIKIGDQHGSGRADLIDHFQFFEGRQQSVQAQRRPDARQFLLGEQAGQIIVAPARADAADARQVAQERFKDRAGVVVQTAGDRDVQSQCAFRHAAGFGSLQDLP